MNEKPINEPLFYKLCHECVHEMWEGANIDPLFPAALRSWNRHCQRHQDGLKRDIAYITRFRFIPVEWFDVYNKERERVCRACGEKMLTKKGKPHPALRWCKRKDEEHQKLISETLLNFSWERDRYVYELADKQIPLIEARFPDKIKSGELIFNDKKRRASQISYYTMRHGHVVVLCEKCGVLCTFVHSHYSGIIFAQVHHKLPVCHVNATNVMSIFDKKNFICLCLKCHGQSHPWRKRPAPPQIKYVTLDKFMK